MSCPNHPYECCALCQRRTPTDMDAMIDAGWYPDYREGEVRRDGPVCPACFAAHLRVGVDGEYERIPTPERQ